MQIRNYFFIASAIVFLFLSFSGWAQPTVSVIKEAKKLFAAHPKAAIHKAKIAYRLAVNRKQYPEELRCIIIISQFYWNIRDYKNARAITEIGLRQAASYAIDSLSGDIYNVKGLIDYSEAKYEQAIDSYQKAVFYFTKSRLDNKAGITYTNLGICEKKRSRFEQANLYYFKAVEIFRRLKDYENIYGAYNSIGNCFSAVKEFKKAIYYHTMALEQSRKTKNEELISQSLNNLGYSYYENAKPDSALKYLNECIKIRKAERDSGMLVLTFQNIAAVLKQKKQVKQAETYLLRSIEIASKLDMQDELARGYLDLAELYNQDKKYAQAFYAAERSEQLAIILNSPELLEQIYSLKSNMFARDQNYKSGLFYERKRNQIHDSLVNIAKITAITAIETKYQAKEKDERIISLHTQSKLEQHVVRQQKYSILGLAIVVLLMLIILILGIRSYKQKERDHLRIQNLMKELHHRVKNNLQILSSLFALQQMEAGDENVKTSIRDNEMRLNSMNLIHQKLYANETDTRINTSVYLEDLAKNLEISYRKKSGDISISLHVAAESLSIEAEKAVSIGLIVNELVTNAYKYAFKEKGGTITVSLKRKNKNIYTLTVSDDGSGIHQQENMLNGNSFGLKLVRVMAEQLNASTHVKTEVGTSYEFELHL